MSKALDDLDFLRYIARLDWSDDTPTGQELNEAYQRLLSILTPPTADEVCEALSEYYKMNTTYNNEDTPVFYRYVGIKKDVIAYYKRGLLTIPFGRDLPPHLITLIGRFYEAQE